MRANRLDLIAIADLENVINRGADSPYTAADILLLLEVWSSDEFLLPPSQLELRYYCFFLKFQRLQDDNRVMIVDGMVHMIS